MMCKPDVLLYGRSKGHKRILESVAPAHREAMASALSITTPMSHVPLPQSSSSTSGQQGVPEPPPTQRSVAPRPRPQRGGA
eukprot:8985968-Lingulodinium_polyedra.AAC.1